MRTDLLETCPRPSFGFPSRFPEAIDVGQVCEGLRCRVTPQGFGLMEAARSVVTSRHDGRLRVDGNLAAGDRSRSLLIKLAVSFDRKLSSPA